MKNMSLSNEEAKKRAAKAQRTKNANLKLKQAETDKLVSEKRTTAKLRAELKAYKDLISQGWSPPGGK